MKSKKVTIGLIGAGMISEMHIAAAQHDKRGAVTWLADINEKVLRDVAGKYKIPSITNSYHEMLKDPLLDVVIVCTPPITHTKIFLDCVKSGKHVLCEKPLAITRRDLAIMLKAAQKKKRGQIIMEASARHSRVNLKYDYIKKLIDSGKLGKVYHIHHRNSARQARPGIEYHPAAKWFLNKKLSGGGPALDWGVYDFSFLLGLLSDKPKLKKISAYTKNGLDKKKHGGKVFDVEEHAYANLEFDTGLTMYWERGANAHIDAPNQTSIYGTKGGIRVSYCDWESYDVEFFDVTKGGAGTPRCTVKTIKKGNRIDDHHAFMKHFLDVVTGKAKPLVTLGLAAKHLDIVFRIYEDAGRKK